MLKIGITGHQNFEGISDTSWLKQELSNRISELQNIRLGYSSLAIGADVIFAETLLAMRITITVVIPCQGYDSTFSKADLNHYRYLINKSNDQILLDYSHPSQKAFYEAGKFIARNSDILFVLWDGKPAKGLGGTGDVFKYASEEGTTIIHINPWTEKVLIYNPKN